MEYWFAMRTRHLVRPVRSTLDLTIIPSEQTADLGYSGLAEQDAVYALQTSTPWQNFANPGQVPPTDDTWSELS